MGSFSVLVCTEDEVLCAALREQVGGWCAVEREVDILGALERVDESWAQLVIVDLDHFQHGMRFTDLALQRSPVIGLLSGENLPKLSGLVDVGVRQILRRPTGDDTGELVHAMRRLLLQTSGSLRDYLGKNVAVQERKIVGASQRSELLNDLESMLSERRAPRMAVSSIVNVADELITNAVYNAPTDEEGNPKYASTSRRNKIELLPSETATLKFGASETHFGFSVTDNFGQLRMRHFRRSIRRCIFSDDPVEQKDGGAGLGLFVSTRAAHQLVVNVLVGAQTEVVALWSLDRKQLRNRRRQGSLLFFEEEHIRRVGRQRDQTNWTCLFSEVSTA